MDGHADVLKYQQHPNEKVEGMIEVFSEGRRTHYYVTDLDKGNEDRGGCENCDQREIHERDRYEVPLDFEILVAVDAVEAWYLAGVPDWMSDQQNVCPPSDTTQVNKDEFTAVFEQSSYRTKQQLKIEIAQNYDYDLARERNDSFAYVASAVGL
jgi:hypothetical protein